MVSSRDRPSVALPERATASSHNRLTSSIRKRIAGSFNDAMSSPAISNSSSTSRPSAANISTTPLTQAAELVRAIIPVSVQIAICA